MRLAVCHWRFGIALITLLFIGLTTSNALADIIAHQCFELFSQNETPLPGEPPGPPPPPNGQPDYTKTPPPGAEGKAKINYAYNTLSSKEPMQAVGWVTPHFTMDPQVHWLVTSHPSKIEAFNRDLFYPVRPRAPFRGGQRGATASEQWTYYVFENMSRILEDLISKNDHGLDEYEVFFIHRIKQVLAVGTVDLRIVPPKSGLFDPNDSVHRIAVTRGAPDRLDEPIFLNQDYFSMLDQARMHRNDSVDPDSLAVMTKPNGEQVIRPPRSDWTYVMPPSQMAEIKKINLVELQNTYFAILIHELGHYLGIPDSPDRPLDQIAARITQAIFGRIERHNLAGFQQPLTEFQLIPFKKFKSKRQIFLVDFANAYDLTESVVEYIENKLKTKVIEVDYKEVSLEKDHSWDSQNWTYTRALMLTAVAQTASGPREVRLRIVIEPSVSETMGFDPKHPRVKGIDPDYHYANKDNIATPINSISQEPSMARIYIQERTEKLSTNNPKVKFLQTMNSQKELQPGETWKFAVMVDVPNSVNIKNIQAILTSKDFVWSGPIKQERINATKTWIERIGATQALVHVEYKVPNSIVPMELSVEHILISYKEGQTEINEKLRLQSKLSVQLQGKASRAKLLYYGYPMFMVEPQSAGKLKMPISISSPPGNIFELVTVFQNFKKVVRSQMTVTVFYKDHGDQSRVETFILDPFKPATNSLIRAQPSHIQTTHLNPGIQGMHPNRPLDYVRFGLAVPGTINGKPVESVRIENLYILFDDHDQIFAPMHNTIFVEPN